MRSFKLFNRNNFKMSNLKNKNYGKLKSYN